MIEAAEQVLAGQSGSPGDRAEVVAFLWIDRAAFAWNETIVALLQDENVSSIYLGFGPHVSKSAVKVRDPKVIYLEEPSLIRAAGKVFAAPGDIFLFVLAPVRPPPGFLDNAIGWMRDDLRVGTLSFLANSGGYLSFPHRNTETPFGVEGFDEVSLTARLRAHSDSGARPTPLPIADGPLVVVSRSIWEVCGDLDDDDTNSLAFATAELSLRGARRGFISYLDHSTFLTAPWDGGGAFRSILTNPDARYALHRKHGHFPACYDAERTRPNSVVGQTLDSARAYSMGLRILLDGSQLGPKEMGTQISIVKLAEALALRSETQFVTIGLPNPTNIPEYARSALSNGKIRFVPVDDLNFPGAEDVDIIHRPFQPTGPIPWERWRSLSKRCIITIQDLIAYRNGAYFSDWADWDRYRENFNRQVGNADGILTISRDVVTSIHEERLPIDDQRIFVVEAGADARSGDEISEVPQAILRRGWAAAPYLFVLGATYAHKNRDLALRVWSQLRAKGYPHKMILVGATVPFGSTRVDEALLSTKNLRDDLIVLPEVNSQERNWLLRNAALAVYLTSAEGFGLLPFEAASFGVPALFVSFGPLRELVQDETLPVSYELSVLTDRAEKLLSDPALAQASIKAILKNMGRLSWAETGRKSIEAYFRVLNLPARIFR